MEKILPFVQITVAASVAFVWIFRHENVNKEFKQFGLSDLTRSFVGCSKIALATLLVVGIWYPPVLKTAALLMGLFMVSAQCFHFKVKNPFSKHLPSLILLLLCALIVAYTT